MVDIYVDATEMFFEFVLYASNDLSSWRFESRASGWQRYVNEVVNARIPGDRLGSTVAKFEWRVVIRSMDDQSRTPMFKLR